MHQRGGDNMKNISVYSETMSPLELREALAYARKYAKEVVGVYYDGQVIKRLVLPARKGEGIINGINY